MAEEWRTYWFSRYSRMVKTDGSFHGMHPRGVLPFGKNGTVGFCIFFPSGNSDSCSHSLWKRKSLFFMPPITLPKQTSIKHNRTPEWDGGKGGFFPLYFRWSKQYVDRIKNLHLVNKGSFYVSKLSKPR
ncbi:hypothetical protein CEXT_695431 [Caerostris extrusa]|uniref:Uncharacterized protein n=1 Tax=Caerostris extrusa TaxID=172846 RepID=A0AAV4R0I4_CAEEX|nr:hypothetical protein CEXT_695431 [Caerostris extrusa]